MQQDSFDFLKRLVDTPGPSGYEQQVQRVFSDRVAAYATDVHKDVLGNVYATVNPGGSPRILLAGHADEIGFQVRYISEEGMLYFGSIGGHDAVVTVGQRVIVHTVSGPVPETPRPQAGFLPQRLEPPPDGGRFLFSKRQACPVPLSQFHISNLLPAVSKISFEQMLCLVFQQERT